MIELHKFDMHRENGLFGEDIRLAMQLYEEAFPVSERRTATEWLKQTERSSLFQPYIIKYAGNFAGIITIWKFEDFVYIEHFATMPHLRGKGLGKRVLAQMRGKFPQLPFCLEAEHPEDKMAQRRIGFYERQGFAVAETPEPYIQPPYEKDGEWLPLCLMTTHPQFVKDHFFRIRETLYKIVYLQK